MSVAAVLDGWQRHAVCHDREVLFFPRDYEMGRGRRLREAQAKQVCAACPVVRPCAAWALATAEPWGIWGGLTEAERWQRLHPGRPMPRGWQP